MSFGLRFVIILSLLLGASSSGATLLHFADGKSFDIGRMLGFGGSAEIYEIVDRPDAALRISRPGAEALMRETVSAYRHLRNAGIPTLRLLETNELYEYVVMERLPADAFSLKTFLSGPIGDRPREDLLRFVRTLAKYYYVGDAKAENIFYLPKRGQWVLIDWTEGLWAVAKGDPDALTNMGLVDGWFRNLTLSPGRQILKEEIYRTVRDVRRQALQPDPCETLLNLSSGMF